MKNIYFSLVYPRIYTLVMRPTRSRSQLFRFTTMIINDIWHRRRHRRGAVLYNCAASPSRRSARPVVRAKYYYKIFPIITPFVLGGRLILARTASLMVNWIPSPGRVRVARAPRPHARIRNAQAHIQCDGRQRAERRVYTRRRLG